MTAPSVRRGTAESAVVLHESWQLDGKAGLSHLNVQILTTVLHSMPVARKQLDDSLTTVIQISCLTLKTQTAFHIDEAFKATPDSRC